MKNIRNIAIIAHVDHGKTTLVDQILRSSGTFRENQELENRVMDSNDIEKERGITILAKNTAINYEGTRINIMDTPGHADFGGEVERIMKMVDGVILVVDAFEGTMPQTRFVLKKALESKIKPMVVINKIDRPMADPKRVLDEVLDLFLELGADDELLDFKTIYVSALKGTSSLSPEIDSQVPGMKCLLDAIVAEMPAPATDVNGSLQFQPALLDYNDYVGKIGIGRIQRGKISSGQVVEVGRLDGSVKQFRIQKLLGFIGLNKVELQEAEAGEIVAIAGLPDLMVGETICEVGKLDILPPLHIDEPTLQMTFGTNTSPFSGNDGTQLTCRKIEERLFKEMQRDVSLRVARIPNTESFTVSGRGELHLSVLIENMRREGFELQVSKPEVIIKQIDGVDYEPFEELQIDVPDEHVGTIMETLGNRGANLVDMISTNTQTRLNYVIPSRGLLGFMTNFLTLTKGYGIINHTFKEYRPKLKMNVGKRIVGVLVATDDGQATPYAMQSVEERGTMFIDPSIQVYEGLIVGENRYDMDLAVNVCRTKNLTNQRSSNKDNTVVLKSPRKMTLEECLDYINDDELVEITPLCFRMRKKILGTTERKKKDSKAKNAE